MRALLDECVPRRLLRELPGLPVSHVRDEGWTGHRNGALLRLMAAAGFDVLVTVDRNMVYQQNVAAAGVAIVVLHAQGNRTQDLVPLIPALHEAGGESVIGSASWRAAVASHEHGIAR